MTNQYLKRFWQRFGAFPNIPICPRQFKTILWIPSSQLIGISFDQFSYIQVLEKEANFFFFLQQNMITTNNQILTFFVFT